MKAGDLMASLEVGCGEDQKREPYRASKIMVVKVAKLSSRLAQPHAEVRDVKRRVCLFRVVKH